MTKREVYTWMLGFMLGVPTGMLLLAAILFIGRMMTGAA